ncbi:MAG: VCBS repeat-containing protein [Acidobacteria bacterium]|nr:VCBS repeat-containing protein [Acidobacteriota bacterium]
MVTANSISNSVSILLGDGMGGFGPRTDFPVTGAFLLNAADFDLDGNPDLAVATNAPETRVAILLGDGMGGFGPATYFGTPSTATSPATIAVGDFNRDGKPDVARGGGINIPENTNNLSVLLGDGKGGFGERTIFPLGIGGTGPAAADFNRDGKLDLVHSTGGQTNTVSVLLGDGRGGFGERTTFPVLGDGAGRVEVGDFNRDGKPDIVTPNARSGNVSILLNTCAP